MTENLTSNVEKKDIYRKAKNWQIALTTINSGGAMCFYMLSYNIYRHIHSIMYNIILFN